MRAVVQRVKRARVEVDGEITGAIERGLVAFVGAAQEDGEGDVLYTVRRLSTFESFQTPRARWGSPCPTSTAAYSS